MINRRGILLGLGAAMAVPAIVHAGNLMPVKRIFIPETWLPCDGRLLRIADYPKLAGILDAYHPFKSEAGYFKVPYLHGYLIATDKIANVIPAGGIMCNYVRFPL